MGVLDVLSRKKGVIVGDDVLKASFLDLAQPDIRLTDPFKQLFQYAKEHKFAIPAIVSAQITSLRPLLSSSLPYPSSEGPG